VTLIKPLANPDPQAATQPQRPRFFVLFSFLKTQLATCGPATFGHFLLTCLFTYPLILRVGDSLPGMLLEDRDQNIWNLWWVRYSLLHFKNPFHTDFIYYPDGVSLYFHTLNFMNAVVSLPAQLLFGTTVAYNFVVFFSFILGGLGAYALLTYLCRNRAAAFVGSLVFVYAPYHLGTLKGLLQLISLEWLPFYILFLLMATREATHRKRNILLAALFLVCTGLTDWYYTLFLLMFTALYTVYWWGQFLVKQFAKTKDRQGDLALPNQATQKTNKVWLIISPTLPIVAILALFTLAISPLLLPMLKELNSTDYYLPTSKAATDFSANVAAFFVPPTTSTVLGGLAQKFPAQYVTGPLAAQVYLGYVALAVGAVGLLFRRQSRFWGVTLLIFWLLSFGPRLQINGDTPGWPMPFALIQNLPIIKVSRSPDRFMVIGMLALAVCVGWGLDWLMSKFSATGRPETKTHLLNQRRVWLAGGVGLLIILEFLQIPYPVNTIETSPFWQKLAQDQIDYSIIELPPQGGFWSGGPRMAAQSIHHKRIFDGYISREFDHPFYRDTPGFEQLAVLRTVPEVFVSPNPANLPGQQLWYDAFNYYQVRYIVLDLPQNQKQRDTFDLNKNREAIYQVLGQNAQPVYSDKFLEAYQMPAIPASLNPVLQVGDGWYAAEPDADNKGAHRWAKSTATLNILRGEAASHKASLYLKMGLLNSVPKQLTIRLNGQPIYSGMLQGPPQNLELPLELPLGVSQLQFQVEGTAQTPQALNMGADIRPLLYYIDNVELNAAS
jgi:hypothetical protein